MKKNYLAMYIVIFLLSSCSKLFGQDCKDFRYLSALLKIETDSEIKAEMKRVFSRELRKRKKYDKLMVSSRVDYLPLYRTFGKVLDSIFLKQNNIPTLQIELQERYDESKRFESYELTCLPDLIASKNADLELRFSKPIENYVIAELLDKRLNLGRVKYGKAIQFLFLFNELGIITKVHTTARLYN